VETVKATVVGEGRWMERWGRGASIEDFVLLHCCCCWVLS